MSTLSPADRRHFDLLVTQQLNGRRRFFAVRQSQVRQHVLLLACVAVTIVVSGECLEEGLEVDYCQCYNSGCGGSDDECKL